MTSTTAMSSGSAASSASASASAASTDARVRLAARIQQLKPSATLAVSAKVRELKAAGADVIGFGTGEPDFHTPAFICDAAVDALRAGDTHYAPVPGQPDARAAIASKLQCENNIACAAEDIIITTGAKHAIYEALHTLVQEGDDVVLPTPAWVSYAPMAELAGGRVIEVPTTIDNEFKMTPEQLDQAITPMTRVMILNSPSNPCGTMYSPEELRSLAEVIAQHPQIVVISDEIYEKLIYTDIPHFSIGSIAAIADRVITVNGLSKAFAMTGWRIGYACAPSGIAKAMSKLQSQSTSGITSFNNAAVVAALNDPQSADHIESMRQVFAERGRLIFDRFQNMPLVRTAQPTGAFYIFPDVSATFGRTTKSGCVIESSVSFADALLEEVHVALVPGEDFGQCAATHVRLSFASSETEIKVGCERIHAFLDSLT